MISRTWRAKAPSRAAASSTWSRRSLHVSAPEPEAAPAADPASLDERIASADRLGHHLGHYGLGSAAPPSAAGPGAVIQFGRKKEGEKKKTKKEEKKKEEEEEGYEADNEEELGEKMAQFGARAEASIRRKVKRKQKKTINQKVKDLGSFLGTTTKHEGFLDNLDSFTEEVILNETKAKQLKLPLRKGVTINTRSLNWGTGYKKKQKEEGVPMEINPITQEVGALGSYPKVNELNLGAAKKRGAKGLQDQKKHIAKFLSQPTKEIVAPGSSEDEPPFMTLKRTKSLLNTEGRRREGVKTVNKLRINKAQSTGSLTELFGSEGIMVPENAPKWFSPLYTQQKQQQDKQIGKTYRELVEESKKYEKEDSSEESDRPPILGKIGGYDPMDLGKSISEWEEGPKSKGKKEKEKEKRSQEKKIVKEMIRLHRETSDLDVGSDETSGESGEESWKVSRQDIVEKTPRKKKARTRRKKTRFTHKKKSTVPKETESKKRKKDEEISSSSSEEKKIVKKKRKLDKKKPTRKK